MEGNDFLKKLDEALKTGDPTKGLDAIQKIKDIDKLADGIDPETAENSFNKRIEEATQKATLTDDEMAKIDKENEKLKKQLSVEQEKLRLLAEIENYAHDIESLENELIEINEKFNKEIAIKTADLKTLKYKLKTKFEKDGE